MGYGSTSSIDWRFNWRPIDWPGLTLLELPQNLHKSASGGETPDQVALSDIFG